MPKSSKAASVKPKVSIVVPIYNVEKYLIIAAKLLTSMPPKTLALYPFIKRTAATVLPSIRVSI